MKSDALDGQAAFEFTADMRFNDTLDQALFDLNVQEGYQLVSPEQEDAN